MARKILAYVLVFMDSINILLTLIVRAGDRTFSEEMEICLTEFREVKKNRLGPYMKREKPDEVIPFLKLIQCIPKAAREEFISDVQAMVHDLVKRNKSEFHLKMTVLSHFFSTVFFVLLDTLKGYFSLKSKSSKNN